MKGCRQRDLSSGSSSPSINQESNITPILFATIFFDQNIFAESLHAFKDESSQTERIVYVCEEVR
jgi:hypothetical protein